MKLFFTYASYPISVEHYLTLSTLIFLIGIIGICVNRKNVITIFMSILLMFLGIIINFLAFSFFTNTIAGQVFSFFILAISSTQLAVGLAILVVYFRNRASIDVKHLNKLKG